MLKWVVTAGANGTQQKNNKNELNGYSDDLQTSNKNKDTSGVTFSTANATLEISRSGELSITDITENPNSLSKNSHSSLDKKRLSSSGEADSLLDETSDSLSDEFAPQEGVAMDTDNQQTSLDNAADSCGSGEENYSQSPAKGIVICHGQNCDSGISTGSRDADESCYNSGTDTSFDTTPSPNAHVAKGTTHRLEVNHCKDCTEQNTRVEKGNKNENYSSQRTVNGLIERNKLACLEINNLSPSSQKHKTDPEFSERGNSGDTIHTHLRVVTKPEQNIQDTDTINCALDECGISVDFSEEFGDDSDDNFGGYSSDTDTIDAVFDDEVTSLGDSTQGEEGQEQESIHVRRSRLVEQIDREIKLKAGADNLYKASENRRLRETIAVEIRFIESHIKLLTDQLADLDFSMEKKEPGEQSCTVFPMIQLGFKETKDVGSSTAFKNYISEHYFENGDSYDKEIEAFENMRQLTRSPIRNEGGVELLFEYYNRLYFLDKRFYTPDNKLNVYFEWFDSISGKSTIQKTVGFEKGSQLFNIGALYSHIAAHQKRRTEKELLCAREYFQKSAGILRYLLENFSNAPSQDMQPHTLKILSHLMLCQAQECHNDTVHLNADPQTTSEHIALAQHAALLYEMYRYARQQMHFDCIKEYLPQNWHILVQVKTLFYKALANYHAARAIMCTYTLKNGERKTVEVEVQDMFEPLSPSRMSINLSSVSQDLDDLAASRFFRAGDSAQRKYLAKACLSRSVLAHEEALRVHKQHQRVRRMPYYHDVHTRLKSAHDTCFKYYSNMEEEDDFTELSIVPNIKSKQGDALKPLPPDFSKYKVTDIFHKLGPLPIFCAKHTWTAPLRVDMHKKSGQGFGFSVRGDAPVIIAEVDPGSLAERAGMRVGDFIVAVDSQDAKWSRHEAVVKLIRAAGHRLVLSLVTPLDKNYLRPRIQSADILDSDLSKPEMNGHKPRVRRVSANSKSLDRNFRRDDQARNSSKSTKSFSTWTLKKFRGRHRDKLPVQQIMHDEFSDI